MTSTEALSMSEARKQLGALLDRASRDHEPVYIARRGQRIAAIINADDLDRLLELAEDMADIRAAAAARDEMQTLAETPIPWDEVKADLGLA